MAGSEYLRSPAAVSKIAEFILLLSAFIIISLYNSYFNPTAEVDVPRPDHTERLSFFLISTITLWLFASLVFVFSLSTVSDRIGKVWNVLIMVISIFSALLLLVSSSLLLNEVTHLANYQTPLGKVDLCKALRHAGKQSCGHLQIAAICGFSAMVLFIGDFLVYYFKLTL